ncbi:nucleoside hydrolase [Bacillus sp. RG28]|uniref:Nucleoside hydrolase n=1 Tax=Gottfriedia endophytica TaxID=2820819 RepID=A0A940NTB9_9BACI|nr:nucleoside hydrolase [Gottfriedia endophytica]MBP0727163.1 nucleoside hydrolase [Gottfriedia endophytica]
MGKKVLIFSDVGIDDAVALAYANLTDDIDLIGIVADYGNVSKEEATRNVRFLLKRFGKEYIKVYGGAEKPMTGEFPTYYPEVHGPFGLGPIDPGLQFENLENFFDVIKLIEQYKHELIIVNTGRLTSLATLFILYEDLMKNVNSYYIMGGAFLYPGNVTPSAEANFYGDPVAANIVMKYVKSAYIFPLNVTQNAIVTPKMVNYINTKDKTQLLKPMMDYYYFNFYQKKVPGIQGGPVHDAVTLMAVIRSDLFTFYQSPVVIDITDVARGQSSADFRVTDAPEQFDGRPQQHIAVGLDYEGFYKDFMSVMTGEKF